MGNERKDFFSALRRQLEEKPDAKFDGEFWDKFNQEFGTKLPPAPSWNWTWRRFTSYLTPMAIAAALVLVVVPMAQKSPTRQYLVELGMVEQAPMLKDLDLFLGQGEGNEDLAMMSDEEWNILLNERSG